MLDHGEADDKLLAILVDDPLLGGIRELEGLPPILVERLMHYFSTYKLDRGSPSAVLVGAPYGRERAEAVVVAGLEDYRIAFPAADPKY